MLEEAKYSSWKNFGDMDPRENGGNYVTWTGSKWKFISTRIMREERQERIGEKYMGLQYSMWPSDIWKDPDDLEKGLTEDVKSKFSVLGDSDIDPTNVERIIVNLSQIPMEMNAKDFYFSNYWEEMESYGIYQSTVT